MYSKIENIEIMINDETDEAMKELFDSFKNRYQNNLESMKGSEFVFDYVQLLHYKYKINPNRRGSYIDSPFINKCNKEEINFQSRKGDQKKFEKNSVKIAFNVLYTEKEKIYPAYVWKYNSNRAKQVILLIISNREKQWHYLAVKELSTLLRGITFKHHSDFYYLNCFHSFATEKNLNHIKKYVKIKIFATC